MKKLTFPFLSLLLAGIVLFGSGCKKDPVDVNEEELITTLRMTWTPEGGGTERVFEFNDPDGPGGTAPTVFSDTLAANTTYNVAIEVLDESATPTKDITEEILEEGPDHQFFFATTSGVVLQFSYEDTDANGAPIGLQTKMYTKEPGSGLLRVTLRHDLAKGASGVPQGDITNAGGETDIEVDFPLHVR